MRLHELVGRMQNPLVSRGARSDSDGSTADSLIAPSPSFFFSAVSLPLLVPPCGPNSWAPLTFTSLLGTASDGGGRLLFTFVSHDALPRSS